jgi:hypothetical protein
MDFRTGPAHRDARASNAARSMLDMAHPGDVGHHADHAVALLFGYERRRRPEATNRPVAGREVDVDRLRVAAGSHVPHDVVEPIDVFAVQVATIRASSGRSSSASSRAAMAMRRTNAAHRSMASRRKVPTRASLLPVAVEVMERHCAKARVVGPYLIRRRLPAVVRGRWRRPRGARAFWCRSWPSRCVCAS